MAAESEPAKKTDPAKLSVQDFEKFTEWLNKHAKNQAFFCPVCKNNSWNAARELVEVSTFQGGSPIQTSGSVYPQIMLLCSVCGYTMFFSAIAVGIVEVPKKEADGK